MKVLYLTESLTIPGGRARFSRDLIRVMAEEHGVEPVILCMEPKPEEGYPFKPENTRLVFSEWSGKRQHIGAGINLFKIRPHMSEVDLIHSLAEPLSTTAWLASRVFRRPFIVSGLGTYAVEPFLLGAKVWKKLATHVYNQADAIPCISHYTRDRLLKVCPGAPARAVPIGHTAPVCTLNCEHNPENPYFLTVGPLKTRKGQIHTLNAFKTIADKYPDVEWVLAGYSYAQEYPKWFEKQVEESGLADRIHILGTIDEEALQGLYQGCLFNILTPISDDHAFEGFGLTYLEAGFHGRPSIAAYGCGATESITDGVEGLLVPPGDEEALAKALDRMLGNPEEREEMGRAAAEKAGRMTWSATGAELNGLYKEVLIKR